MTNRETVIVELTDSIEILSDFDTQEYTFRERQQLHGSVIAAIQDTLELLKAQEPRVMTLIEWISAPEPADGECMCYEIKDNGLQAMLVKAFDGATHLYGKAFRCWTSRPTDEQREAIPWLT